MTHHFRQVLPLLAVLVIAGCSGSGTMIDAPDAAPMASSMTSPMEAPTVFDDPSIVERYQATITPEDLAAYLYVFASDYFEGRETSTRGQKLAATYLAGQYRKIGVAPYGNMAPRDSWAPEAYLQTVPLYTQKLKTASLAASHEGSEVARTSFGRMGGDGQAYLVFGTMPERTGSVVFAGYGIADDDLGYNDFSALADAGIDIGGKWLIYLGGEPLASADKSLLATEDGKPSAWTTSANTKLRTILRADQVPAGVLRIGDLGPRASDVGAEARERAAAIDEGVGGLSLEPGSGRGRQFPPIYTVTAEFANKLLAPSGKTVEALKAQIDKSLTPEVFALESVEVHGTIENEAVEAPSENVVAFLEGSDPELKHEVVVLSSHYDHIGFGGPNEDGDTINNGADDDGSGTVGVLEMAEAFVKAKADGYGPRRSILFLNVTGEEKGLLGSRYFTDSDPLVPLTDIVTNLNIDMIGRFDPTHPTKSENYVYIIGSNLISQELHDINAQVNDVTGTNLELDERFNSKDDPNQFYRRSDHWNFGKHSIPFIFYFTGTHEDYHGLGDEAHKVEYERMARIARLIFGTAWQVANQDERPAVSGEGFN